MQSLQRRALLGSLGTTGLSLLAGCATSGGDPESTTTTDAGTTRPTTTETTEATTTRPTETTTAEATATALGGSPGPLPVEPWPLPRRSASNCAFLPDGPSLSRDAVEDWRVEPIRLSEEDRYSPEFSGPVVADGVVVVANRLVFGTNVEAPDEQLLRAFDAENGDQTWKYTIGSESAPADRGLPTTPAVWNDVVLVGNGRTVRAVNIGDGTEVWQRSLGTQIHAVVPADDLVYVRAHRSIIALDSGDDRVWSTPVDEYPQRLAVGHRHLYVSESRRMHALDPENGTERWSVGLPAVDGGYAVSRLMAVEGGVIAMQNSGDVYGISEDGTRRWRSDARYGSIATDGTRVYAGSDGTLRALDVSTGERLWERTCSDVPNCDSETTFGPSVLTGDSLVVSLDDGLLAVVPADGETRWSLDDVPGPEHLALGLDAVYGVGESFLSRIATPSRS